MINRLIIKQRLSMIEDFCRELELIRDLPKEEFFLKRNTAAAESFLRRSLEAVFDTGRHILAKSGHLDLAGEYKSIALGLSKQKVVTGSLSQALLEMAGYRNRLVHLYQMVTEEELYTITHNNLPDLYEFIKQVSKYINRLG